jgi:hypothetical protein
VEETVYRGWSEVENITVMLDEYNWPQDPAIEIDADNVVHTFWYQEFADGMMEPTGEDVYYKTRSGGSWSDHSDILADHAGRYTDLTLESSGYPAFAWGEDVADNRDVFLARRRDPASVPGGATNASLHLTIQPNPCRGSAAIEFVLDRPGSARLDVYDVTGRLIARLADGARAAGSHSLRWDGRDAQGRRASSAVYRARLTTAGQTTTSPIVLLE